MKSCIQTKLWFELRCWQETGGSGTTLETGTRIEQFVTNVSVLGEEGFSA